MAAPGMAEPRSKRPRGTLPACPAHRPLPASRVRHGFPPAVEEALCGVTGAQLELHYCLQALVRRRGQRGRGRARRAACVPHLSPFPPAEGKGSAGARLRKV